MLLQKEREAVVAYSRQMLAAGLTKGTGGNISIRNGEYVAISPSGVPYDTMRPEDVPVLRLADASVADGTLRPSTEWEMHLLCLRGRDDITAVVHTHSPFAATVSCMGLSLPPVHFLMGCAGSTVPCIPYYTFGSPELARAAAAALPTGQNGILLGNHGLLAVGSDIAAAFSVAENLEMVCEIYWRTLAAGKEPVLLTEEQMAASMASLAGYGQKK